MHRGRVPCGLESCSGLVTHGTAMAMAMSRARDGAVSRRAVRRVDCEESSRRVSYKRRPHLPPPKRLPTSHELDVFDAQKKQQDLHRTRAFEFLCENDETSDRSFNLPDNLVDDGSWSSRILTQVRIFPHQHIFLLIYLFIISNLSVGLCFCKESSYGDVFSSS
jgi:hypothetical protein